MEFSVVVLLEVLLLGMQAISVSLQENETYFRSQIEQLPNSQDLFEKSDELTSFNNESAIMIPNANNTEDISKTVNIESRSWLNGEPSPVYEEDYDDGNAEDDITNVSDEDENLEVNFRFHLKNDDSALRDLLKDILNKSGYDSPVGSVYRHRVIPQNEQDFPFLIAYKVFENISDLSNIQFKNESGQALPLPGGYNKIFILNAVVKSHNIPGVQVFNGKNLSHSNITGSEEASYRTHFQNTADQQGDENWKVDLAIDVSNVASEPSSLFNDEQGDVVPLDGRNSSEILNSENDTEGASADENPIHGNTSAGQQLNNERNLVDKHTVENVSEDGKTFPTTNSENDNRGEEPIRVYRRNASPDDNNRNQVQPDVASYVEGNEPEQANIKNRIKRQGKPFFSVMCLLFHTC